MPWYWPSLRARGQCGDPSAAGKRTKSASPAGGPRRRVRRIATSFPRRRFRLWSNYRRILGLRRSVCVAAHRGRSSSVPAPRLGRSIRCQGQLEAATAQILAACPKGRNIQEQPLAIWYAWCQATNDITILDGPPTKAFRKTHCSSYIVPDFLIAMQCGAQRLIEVKPSSKLGRPLVQPQVVGRSSVRRTPGLDISRYYGNDSSQPVRSWPTFVYWDDFANDTRVSFRRSS